MPDKKSNSDANMKVPNPGSKLGTIDQRSIEHLKNTMDVLNKPANSTNIWEAFAALSKLSNGHTCLTIDLNASKQIGTPVIFATPDHKKSLFAPLTTRQNQVATLIAAGQSNKQIANDLNIAISTVKDHVHAVLTKLSLASRTQLIAAANSPR